MNDLAYHHAKAAQRALDNAVAWLGQPGELTTIEGNRIRGLLDQVLVQARLAVAHIDTPGGNVTTRTP